MAESNIEYPILSSDLQVGFYFRLKSLRDLYFHDSLRRSVERLRISEIDKQLNELVPEKSLQKLASLSLRGEAVFPLPIILNDNPFLIGYYRLFLGFSQKEFYSKGPFGAFRTMEDKGKLSGYASKNLFSLCKSLIKTTDLFIHQIGDFNISALTELQLLTVGPQFRGSKNNEYGQIATQKTFSIIKDLVTKYINTSSPTSIEIINNSGRKVVIRFTSDPDIEITESLPTGDRGLISIEIKGGKDISNIHNRIGEAEKSHQKAKQRGHFEFMTIISVEFDYMQLKSESPTTTHFFHLDRITDKRSQEYKKFTDILSSILGVNI